MNKRDAQARVVLAAGLELLERGEGLEAADDQQTLDLVLGEPGCNALEVLARLLAVRAELGSAARRPLVNAEPAQLDDVVLEEAGDRVVDGQRRVAAREAEADGRARRCVHPARRRAEAARQSTSRQIRRTA